MADYRAKVLDIVEQWSASLLARSDSVRVSIKSSKLATKGKLGISINGTTVQLMVPEEADALIQIEQPDWLSCDINSEIICNAIPINKILASVLSRCLRHTLLTSSASLLSSGSLSSGESSSEVYSEDLGMSLGASQGFMEVEAGSAFSMTSGEYSELISQVEECAAVIGEENIRVVEDLGSIKINLSVWELLSEENCTQLGIEFGAPVLVTLNYERSREPRIAVVQPGNEDAFAVNTWFLSVVRFFVTKFFQDPQYLDKKPNPPEATKAMNWSVSLNQRSASTSGTVKTAPAPPSSSSSMKSKPKPKQSFLSRVFGRKPKEEEKTHPSGAPNLQKKAKVSEKRVVEPPSDLPAEGMLSTVCGMGFDVFSAYNALTKHKTAEAAIDGLLSAPGDYRVTRGDAIELHATLVSMGFASNMSVYALLRADFNFDAAVACAAGEPVGDLVEEAARALVDTSQGNFFFRLFEYLGSRLGTLGSYCIVCNAPHNCINRHAVVCCEALCVFQWEDQNMGERLMPTHLCPFKNCGDRDLSASHAAYMGQSIGEMSEQFGVPPDTLLEMLGHNYLPLEAMKLFFAALKTTKAKKITNILNPPLAARFERCWERMRKEFPESQPEVCFHGTSPQNVSKIKETGFLISKVGSTTDAGFYGAGIYLSPNAQLSVGYCRGGGQLLVCAVLRGKVWKCKGLEMGAKLHAGYHSHEDPSGNEWVMFDEAAMLPCFMVEI